MTVGKVSFKIVPLLLLLFCMNYPPITCQNCGLPATIRVSEQLAESMDTGQITSPIPARNSVRISREINNPQHFANITLVPETGSSSAILLLEVGTPLWKPSVTSYIDESRLEEIRIVVELECSDGRNKEIEIIVPIIDENTAMPRFAEPHYELITEPCVLERCTLIFEKDIIVIDQDRDEKNAEVNLWSDMPNMNVLHQYSLLETWYSDNESEGLKPKGFQVRIKLEYIRQKIFTKSIRFKMYVNNVVSPVASLVSTTAAFSTVTIHFEENPDRIVAPVFTSPMYFAFVENEGEKVSTEPRNIYASVPGQYHNESDIQYVIEGEPEMFSIDCMGDISFIKNIGIMDRYSISYRQVTYNVKAERRMSKEGVVVASSNVPLIAYFGYPTCPAPEPCPSSPSPTTEPSPTTTPDATTSETYPATSATNTAPTATYPATSETYLPTSATYPATSETYPPTSATYPTTTELPSTTQDTTSTHNPPTPPPGQCTCNCSDFTCADPQVGSSLNSTFYRYYPDPYNCSMYHRCPNREYDLIYDNDTETYACPADTVFCPVMSACTTVEMCLNQHYRKANNSSIIVITGGYGGGYWGDDGDIEEEECKECQCWNGFMPGHPNNTCTAEYYDQYQLTPDEKFCDVFHQCQLTGRGGYIDYPRRCPPGLVFCPDKGICGYHYDHGCSCGDRIFKQCDVCIMGRWENFDIFNKKFI